MIMMMAVVPAAIFLTNYSYPSVVSATLTPSRELKELHEARQLSILCVTAPVERKCILWYEHGHGSEKNE